VHRGKGSAAAVASTRYWERHEAVVVVAHDRRRYRIDPKDASRLGFFLANGMISHGERPRPPIVV
jgi:hypothetical protein